MYQTNDDYTPLACKLDGLRTVDIAPGWDKAAAWERGAPKYQKKAGRAAVWVWSAAGALAAALAGIILLLSAPGSSVQGVGTVALHGLGGRTQSPASFKEHKAVVTVPIIAVRQPEPGKEMHRTITINERRHPISLEKIAGPASDTFSANAFVSREQIPAEAMQPASAPRTRRPQPVIYTLAEILADVPEREEAPRRYTTKIFFLRPPAYVPPPAPEVRERQSAYPNESYSLPIIN